MTGQVDKKRFGWRTLAALGLGIVMGGALVGQPATAHYLPIIEHILFHMIPELDRAYRTEAWANASSIDIDNFTTRTYTSILSTGFIASSKGYVMITGSLGAADDVSLAGLGSLYFRVRLNATGATNDTFANPVSSGVENGPGNTGSTTVIVPVTKGVHTVFLDAREYGSGSFIYSRNINAVFFPQGKGVPIPF